jgi:hypothetical protein
MWERVPFMRQNRTASTPLDDLGGHNVRWFVKFFWARIKAEKNEP